MANYLVTDAELTATADAIREKTGGTDLITWDESKGFSDAVSGISAGGGGDIDDLIAGRIVNLNSNVTVVRRAGLSYSYDLETANLPEVTSVGQAGFTGCDKLRTVNLPKANSFQEDAFSYCKVLETVYAPELQSVSGSCFSGCNKLVVVDSPKLNGEIKSYCFNKCYKLTTANYPEVTSIGANAFSGCSELVTTNFAKVKSTSSSSFKDCTSLETISFPVATLLNSSLLEGCTNLTMVDAGFITSINNKCFYKTSLNVLVLRKDSVVSLSYINAFDDTPFAAGGTGGTAYVPQTLITEYQNETNWSTLYAAGTCNFVAIEGSEYE